jgi:peptidoglycan/xylan/chitin deacetylase (PgdA/CDA1 family)
MLKSFAKRFLFGSGLLGTWHRCRNRRNLTVVMFHRVLPREDERFQGANRTYTVTPEEFEQCISLFASFYNLVSLAQIGAAGVGKGNLPDCPLLITFDDGWQDNFQYAFPILTRHRAPALLFLATEYIGSRRGFWQEEFLAAFLRNRSAGPAYAEALARIGKLNATSRADRKQQLANLPEPSELPRRMLDGKELQALRTGGVAIGGHGHSHEPMTELDDSHAEFVACHERLSALDLLEDPVAFSFPHGRYDGDLVAQARSAGFDLLFTSRHTLTPCAKLAACETLGRIEMDLRPFRLADGKLDTARLMSHLSMQQIGYVSGRGTAGGAGDVEA